MKKTLFFTFLITLLSLQGNTQITALNFVLEFNCETAEYDVKLKIIGGSSSSTQHRAQFNSQISFVIPTGESIDITERHLPLQDNQNYNGTIPMDWVLSNATIAPEAQPESDFHPVATILSPASFYNDMSEGDEIHIFSIKVGDSGEYDERVRFFINGEDPDSSSPGMGGIDYSNNFNIGGPIDVYEGNILRGCNSTSVSEELFDLTSIQPNPASEFINLNLVKNANTVQIVDAMGRVIKSERSVQKGIRTISLENIENGLHYLVIDYNGEVVTKKLNIIR